jgi:hypothetical protein
VVKVTKGKVKFNGEFYAVGEWISGLSPDGEARLVKKGVAEYVRELAQEPPTEPETDIEETVEEEEQEEQAEAVTEPADAQIDFNPDDCIVTEKKPRPAPKKATNPKKSGKK